MNASLNKPPPLFSRWQNLALPVAWLVATFGALITFQIRLSASSQGPEVVVGLASVVLCAAVAFIRAGKRPVTVRRSNDKVFLVSVTVCFVCIWVVFSWLREAWTCPYTSTTRLVVASTPSVDFSSYLKARGLGADSSSECAFVKDYVGDTQRMYGYKDLAIRYYTLVGLYLVCWIFMVALVWNSISIVRNFASKSRRSRGT